YFVYSLIFLFFSILLLSYVLYGQENLPYLNPDLPVKERVKDLLSRMTIEEKIAQLQCMLRGEEVIQERGIGGLGVVLRRLGPVEAAKKANKIQRYAYEHTRLKIPVIIHDEALHGLVGKGATSFPQAIGLASTWDTQLMEKVATVIARETKSRGIHQVLSPVINIARDVRWGRVEESYGEDPYLTSRMGVAFCKSIEKEGVITTPKHFVANVGDGGRDSNPIHFSERLLREIYFPAFKACFQEAGARSVMAAYNSIDGLPCSANRWLLTDILRNEWGFKGFVVSDYGSVWGIVFKHNTASTKKEGAKQAIEAGLDVELPNINLYGEPLLQSVKSGLVSESTIDKSVKRILEIKFRMGLFENRYVDPDYAGKINDCKKHRKLALQAAREAIVLLKNEGNTLPLKKDIKSIAVIGPNADAVRLGGYSGSGMKVVTVLEGIKNKVSPGTRVFYEKGCELGKAALPPISSENLISTGEKGMVHGLKGEYFNNMDLSGDPVVVRIDKQVNFDWGGDSPDPKINSDHFSVRWSGKFTVPSTKLYRISITTDDGVRLYVNGRLLVDRWFDRAATTDIVSLKLEAGKQYDICIEYYENGGMAFASLGWDEKSDIEDEIQKAVEVVKKSDAVVVVTGIIEGEGRDRAYLDLPGSQEELIKKVSDVGKPVVVVLINGSAVTMNNWIDRVSAIVEAWYPGEEGGNAIADVLFGDYNPGGKLPITFPQSVGQAPLYYNYKPTGRGYDYIYVSGKPLFPFGYGLSYTEFKYSNLRITPEKITTNEKINISVDVENVGNFRGDEVVQLYLHDVVASMIRPVKELKGFKRITLDPEEKKTVNFVIKPEQLSFLDVNMNRIIEPGIFEVMIGSSSEDIRLKSSFEVVSR
ncbi:beta-glucosidase, partial [candidate division KSB1 bacterium]